jgi:hypothetical protein
MMGNTTYTVNTSSKTFDLPIQKTTEREIFDYIDLSTLLQALSTGGELKLPEVPAEYQGGEEIEIASEFPTDTSAEQSPVSIEPSDTPVVDTSAEQFVPPLEVSDH